MNCSEEFKNISGNELVRMGFLSPILVNMLIQYKYLPVGRIDIFQYLRRIIQNFQYCITIILTKHIH